MKTMNSEQDKKETCAVCGRLTEVSVNLPIRERRTYVPTVGQLCEACCLKLYHTADLRTIPALWDEFF